MTRYFYRCPIAAAWQLKTHAIAINDHSVRTLLQEAQETNKGYYIIHEDSLQFLHPMVGDIMVGDGILCEARLLRGKIIMRNNLAWISPEVEE